jgi:hypothetical protein
MLNLYEVEMPALKAEAYDRGQIKRVSGSYSYLFCSLYIPNGF